jgi:hypothetical protein
MSDKPEPLVGTTKDTLRGRPRGDPPGVSLRDHSGGPLAVEVYISGAPSPPSGCAATGAAFGCPPTKRAAAFGRHPLKVESQIQEMIS